MSDKLYPIELPHLLSWILDEEKSGSIFGITKELFFTPKSNDVFRMRRYGQLMETPIGVAAGPHSQMSQNIVLAWLMGARYIELKTVQTLDELNVSKPCIDMQDEGYNCEWSQELKLRQSFSEYLNAWIIIHILKDKFHWVNPDEIGGIFNMSVGYNLSGIKNANVQDFLNSMENCEPDLQKRLDQISSIYPHVKNLNIPSRISDNLTLSTMHGCPPDEIEAIGNYLIEERGYQTTIKLNPTLLGPDRLRDILYTHLGFTNIVVPDGAFEHDLKYHDAIKLINNLQQKASGKGVGFGLKLTNTLEVDNNKSVFPNKETMMYMSGRALHPISINLAAQLQQDFGGKLDISFSAGVDAFNIVDVLAGGLKPITVCTDILKPGGYTRLAQYLIEIETRIASTNAKSIDDFISAADGQTHGVDAAKNNLNQYASDVLSQPAYQKDRIHFDSIKTHRELTAFDCVKAPCIENCATDQHIPEYLYQIANGNVDKAYQTIIDTNPMPGVTGSVCDHLCQFKCTRNNLDNTLLIREIKRFATDNHKQSAPSPKEKNGKSVAIIGAGPSGLSCAYFLALDGFKADIFEAKSFSGGMVSASIPVFRLSDDSIKNDLDLVKSVGVNIHYNSPISKNEFDELRREYNYIFLAAGAQANKKLRIPGEALPGVIEPLTFLSKIRAGETIEVGKSVAVIGGGNTAMDAARTSRRLGANVTIVYRRTMKEMPADIHEIIAAIEEGIQLIELANPEIISQNINGSLNLTCSKNMLGKIDASGRAQPVKIDGSEFDLEFDMIIPSIGQDIILDFVDWDDLQVNTNTNETKLKNVFAGGDVVRGASSVINAVGDGHRAARNIIEQSDIAVGPNTNGYSMRLDKFEYQKKLALREPGLGTPMLPAAERINFEELTRTLTTDEAKQEADRCLLCDDVCDICVSVCPNLSNLSFMAEPKSYPVYEVEESNRGISAHEMDKFSVGQRPQILNISDFCNECGNCTTFCPTAGDPYKTKPLFHLAQAAFEESEKGYFFIDNELHHKSNGQISVLKLSGHKFRYMNAQVDLEIDSGSYEVLNGSMLNGKSKVTLSHMMEMIFLFENTNHLALLRSMED